METEIPSVTNPREKAIALRNAFSNAIANGCGSNVIVAATPAGLKIQLDDITQAVWHRKGCQVRVVEAGLGFPGGDRFNLILIGIGDCQNEFDQALELATHAGALILQERFIEMPCLQPSGASAWFANVFATLRDTGYVQKLEELGYESYVLNPFGASIEAWNRLLDLPTADTRKAKLKSKNSAGRNRVTRLTPEEKRISEAWNTGLYPTYRDLDDELKLDPGTVKATLDRLRKRISSAK